MSRRSLTSVHTKFGKHGTTGDFSWVRLGQCFVVLCSSLVLLGLVSGETTNRTVCLLTCTHGKNETIAYSACIEKDRETPAVNVALSPSLLSLIFPCDRAGHVVGRRCAWKEKKRKARNTDRTVLDNRIRIVRNAVSEVSQQVLSSLVLSL